MSSSPQNSGPDRPMKPPVGQPGPLPMSGPQQPAAKPEPKPMAMGTPPLRRPQSGGPSVATIILSVIGGIVLLMFLVCGGISYYIYSRVQMVQRGVAARIQQAAQQNHDQNFPPPPPNFGPNFPGNEPIDSVPRALAALDGHDHFRREQAVTFLTTQQFDAVQRDAVVTKALSLVGDWTRREHARRILEKLVVASDADKLHAGMQLAAQRNDHDTQRLMMQLLAKTGDARAADAAVMYLASGHDVGAARQMLQSQGKANAAKLVRLVNHPNHGVRHAARELLTEFQITDTQIAQQCVADLTSNEREQQREAARWLKDHVIVDEKLTPHVNAQLIGQLSNREVRGDMAAALALWATSDNVPDLIEAAEAADTAQDREAQRELVQLLAKLKDKRALPVLADYMAARHDVFAARNAFSAFGPEAAETVMQFANHPDGSLQHFARQLLNEWNVQPTAYVGQSVKDLAATDVNRQRGIAQWLAQQPVDAEQQDVVSAALEPLLDAAETRREAVRALRVWGTRDSVPKLLTLLEDEDVFLRGEVMATLVAIKDPRVLPYLSAALAGDISRRNEAARNLVALGPMAEATVWPHTTSADWQVAMTACNVLKDIGTKKSLPALQLATQHENSIVKNYAEQAIKVVEAEKRTIAPQDEVAATTTTKPARGMREWKDATGKSKIQAEFVEFAGGRVKLKTREGRSLSLNISQLSSEDRRYVIEQMKTP